jgi:hypothetical protein
LEVTSVSAGSARRRRLDRPRTTFLPDGADLGKVPEALQRDLRRIAAHLARGRRLTRSQDALVRRTYERQSWLLAVCGVAAVQTSAGLDIRHTDDAQVMLDDKTVSGDALVERLERIARSIRTGADEADSDEEQEAQLLALVRDHRPDLLAEAGLVWVQPEDGRLGWFDALEVCEDETDVN